MIINQNHIFQQYCGISRIHFNTGFWKQHFLNRKFTLNHFYQKILIAFNVCIQVWCQILIFKIKNLTQKIQAITQTMIMNDFLTQVQKQMIQFRKKNMNTVNEFKIEMFQARRDIQKNLIKLQFGISESQLMSDHQTSENISIIQKESKKEIIDKNLSTNYNSRSLESKINDNCQISRFINPFNKENQDPNRRMNTDISVIEEFPVKNNTFNGNDDMYNELNLNALKNDESMEINTEQVKKKYQKFISPSAGWTMSADPLKERPDHKNPNREITPFCEYFAQEDGNFNEDENHSFRKDTDMFSFKEIDDGHFSLVNTIHELENENEENNESQNY